MRALTMDEVQVVGGGYELHTFEEAQGGGLATYGVTAYRTTSAQPNYTPTNNYLTPSFNSPSLMYGSFDSMNWCGPVNGGFASQDAQLQCYADWYNAGSPDIQGQSGMLSKIGEVLVTASKDGVNRGLIFGHENNAKTHAPSTDGYTIGGNITIASGYDLATKNLGDLKRLHLPSELEKKLSEYLGPRDDAKGYLNEHPLTITKSEADMINAAAAEVMIADVARIYHSRTGNNFEDLPDVIKTVMVDVAYVEGAGFGLSNSKIDHHFSNAITNYDQKTGDITDIVTALRGWQDQGEFSSGHANRWKDDANYLINAVWP